MSDQRFLVSSQLAFTYILIFASANLASASSVCKCGNGDADSPSRKPIFVRFDNESVNNGLPMLEAARDLDFLSQTKKIVDSRQHQLMVATVDYNVEISESGDLFNETIEVDTEKETELIKVPAHNNVNHSNILHDFKMNLSMLLLPEEKICYLLPLDKEMSSPRKLISDLDEAQKAISKTQIIDNKWTVDKEMTDRSVLSDELAKFCAKYPIYYVQKMEDSMASARIETGRTPRKRRQFVSVNLRAMVTASFQSKKSIPSEKLCVGGKRRPTMDDIVVCEFNQGKQWKVKCKIIRQTCYYIDVCETVVNCFSKHVMNTIYCCQYECL